MTYELKDIPQLTKKVRKLNQRIDQLPRCEERDTLIKHRELLKWIIDGIKVTHEIDREEVECEKNLSM